MKTNGSYKARFSLLLPTELYDRLARYAVRQGISLSEAARRALEAGLPILESEAARLDEQREALAAMRRFRKEMAELYGVYQGDLVKEAREERERQMDQVLWPDLVRHEDDSDDEDRILTCGP
jgi:hypothetical protein